MSSRKGKKRQAKVHFVGWTMLGVSSESGLMKGGGQEGQYLGYMTIAPSDDDI